MTIIGIPHNSSLLCVAAADLALPCHGVYLTSRLPPPASQLRQQRWIDGGRVDM